MGAGARFLTLAWFWEDMVNLCDYLRIVGYDVVLLSGYFIACVVDLIQWTVMGWIMRLLRSWCIFVQKNNLVNGEREAGTA